MRTKTKLEATLPIVFECQRLLPDSGGAGTWRGGLGVETKIRVLQDTEFALRAERVKFPPKGREGGHDGVAGTQRAIDLEGGERSLPPKAANQRLAAGETLVLTTSGGGGLGDPAARPPEQLEQDRREGFVTERGAREEYGGGGRS